MITSHGFIGFIGAVAGFYMGVFWVDASATLELTQTKNEVKHLQKELLTERKTIKTLETVSTKREQLVKDFTKNYQVTK